MGFKSTMYDAASALGLSRRGDRGYAFGDVKGVPTLLAHALEERGREIITIVMIFGDESAQSQLQGRLEAAPSLEENKIKASKIKLDQGTLVYHLKKWPSGNPSPEQLKEGLLDLASTINATLPTLYLSCGSCSATNRLETIVSNGNLAQLCERCASRDEEEAARSQRAYGQMSTNILAAVATGALLSVVTAAAGVGITIATGYMFAFLAVGIGFLVTHGVHIAAGKRGLPVQIISGVFTLAAVIMGHAMFDLYILKEQISLGGAKVSYLELLPLVPEMLLTRFLDLIFAICTGLAGAYYAYKTRAADDFTQALDRTDERSRLAAAS